jgi:RNA-directed DNA polymerase
MQKMKTPPNPTRFSICNAEELASLLATKTKQVEWVLSHLKTLYYRKDRIKADGSKRTLWIPRPPLRPLQDKIKTEILAKVSFPTCVQGGVRKRSIITNAKHHVGKPVLSTMDIKNCFPSITVQKVRRVFEDLGFSGNALSIVTKLTTWEFQLPQGPPTSPAIANLALANLDRRQLGVAKEHGFTYTRYVDDISASGGSDCERSGIYRNESSRMRGFRSSLSRTGRRS